jgi:hypothetical protein
MTRIEELTLKLLDDSISDEEVDELEALVERDGPGVEDHFLLLEIEAALRGRSRCPDLRQPVVERLRAEMAVRTQQAVLRTIAKLPAPPWQAGPAATDPRGRRRLARAAWVLTAAAAVVVLVASAVGVALRGGGAPGPGAVEAGPGVRVVDVRGRLEILNPGEEGRLAQVGQTVAPGQTLRTEGEDSFAVVEFADRTRLDLSPASIVRLVGAEAGPRGADKRVLLSSGVLRAEVAPQGDGRSLVILTPVAELRVPGAAALVSVTTPDCTWVDLEDGRAEMTRQSDGRQIEVEAGSSAAVRADLEDMVVKPRMRPLPRPRRRLDFAPAHTLAFSADGATLVAANSRRLYRYSLLSGAEEVVPIPAASPDGTRAALSRDGGTLALSMPDGLSVWDASWMRRRLSVPAPGMPTRPVTLAPDGRWLAAQDGDLGSPAGVSLWDVGSGRLRASWQAGGAVRNLASSIDGGLLIVGTKESPESPTHRILLWDAETAEHRATLITDFPASWQVVLTADGRRLATVGRDGSIQVWHVPNRTLERVIDARERPVRSLAFSPDGRLLAGGTVYGSVLLWDVETGEERPELKAAQRGVRLLAFSPDGKTLATGTLDDPILLWDVPGPVPTDGARAAEGTPAEPGGRDHE